MDNSLQKPFYTHEPFFFHYNRAMSHKMQEFHFHENYEIYYLINGQRRYFIDNEIFDIYPGDMILIPTMQPHKVWNTPGTTQTEYHERFLLSPKKEDISEMFLPLFHTHFYHPTPAALKELQRCFHALQQNSSVQDMYTHSYNCAILNEILCILARLPISEKHNKQFSKNDQLIQMAVLYIKDNCSQPLTLADVAKKYSFSKEYFSTIFKETTGSGFSEYLTQMRISKSIGMLNNTTMSIAEISVACGFNDSNYFSAVFKKIMGGTPKQFRPKAIK